MNVKHKLLTALTTVLSSEKNSDTNPTLPGNMYTGNPANFDWNVILPGQYSYNLKGDSLIMTYMAGANTYSYKLKKVN